MCGEVVGYSECVAEDGCLCVFMRLGMGEGGSRNG